VAKIKSSGFKVRCAEAGKVGGETGPRWSAGARFDGRCLSGCVVGRRYVSFSVRLVWLD
jgi:hypothetical protein